MGQRERCGWKLFIFAREDGLSHASHPCYLNMSPPFVSKVYVNVGEEWAARGVHKMRTAIFRSFEVLEI